MDPEIAQKMGELRQHMEDMLRTSTQGLMALNSRLEQISERQKKLETAMNLIITRFLDLEKKTKEALPETVEGRLKEMLAFTAEYRSDKEQLDRRLFYLQSDVDRLKHKTNLPEDE